MAGKRERPSQSGGTGRSVARHQHWRSGIDFAAVNAAALEHLPALVLRWLPDGRREGYEWSARNPCRKDHLPGSFKVNLKTGRWADFALLDARGGDPVSLAAYLSGTSQDEAAQSLTTMLGIGK